MVGLTQHQCNAIAHKLNTRLRKRLDFRTPLECFNESLSVLHFQVDVSMYKVELCYLSEGLETVPWYKLRSDRPTQYIRRRKGEKIASLGLLCRAGRAFPLDAETAGRLGHRTWLPRKPLARRGPRGAEENTGSSQLEVAVDYRADHGQIFSADATAYLRRNSTAPSAQFCLFSHL
jgi:hypothetical protein